MNLKSVSILKKTQKTTILDLKVQNGCLYCRFENTKIKMLFLTFVLFGEQHKHLFTLSTFIHLQGGETGLFPTATPLLPGSASCFPLAPALLHAPGSGLPGASLWRELQLYTDQQLCPIFLPHAALHQRPPTHMITATLCVHVLLIKR